MDDTKKPAPKRPETRAPSAFRGVRPPEKNCSTLFIGEKLFQLEGVQP